MREISGHKRERYRRRHHGGDGAIPTKSCGDDALKSPPQEFCYVIFEAVKRTLKIRIYYYADDKSCADFSLKMHQKRLAAGLRADTLGELTTLPRPPS